MAKQGSSPDSVPPRVEMFYEVDLGGVTEQRQLPFVIGVLADLDGQPIEPPRRLRERKFYHLDADNFDDHMARIAPRLAFSVEDRLSGEGAKVAVEIRFRQMSDFEPLSVARQIPTLNALVLLRTKLNDLHATLHADSRLDDLIKDAVLTRGGEGGDVESADTIVGRIATRGHLGRFAEDNARAIDYLRIFFRELDEGRMVLSPTTGAMLTERIARIDELLSTQLNEVFHQPEFQRLEGTWRGLERLVRQTDTSSLLKIRVLAVTKKEILRDLQRAAEFDQSALFRLVYEEEFGTLGGEPFGALIADYDFALIPEDMEMLTRISNVAAAASAPFIGAANPNLFNLDSFRQLSMPRDLAKIFDTTAHAQWRAFRESEDSRFVGLVLPRVLQRLPYGRDGAASEGFDYQEGVDGKDPEKYLWGNAVFAFAARLTEAFARYGWCAAISGMEHGGMVLGLPLQRFLSDDGDTVVNCPTEIAISDRRRQELDNLGFIPLCYEKGTDRAVFFEAHSCQKPRKYFSDLADIAAEESAKLEYTLTISRFTHYIRFMTRAKAWPFQSRREWERHLNDWLADYILLDEDAEPHVKARYPLREGRIDVDEVPGHPGRFRVTAYLRPHFQMNPPQSGIKETVGTIDTRTKAPAYGR
jgi:type VI secretion system protein ImpC